jgi:fibronectin-binding autotransporter adhesin
MKFSRQLFSSVIIVRTLIASLLAIPSIQAQQTITYSDGENNSSAIVITSATDPTTVELSSGSATQSGPISESGTQSDVDVSAGTGTLTFTGANSYTGDTTIESGTLAVSGLGASIDSSTTSSVVNVGGSGGSLTISDGGQVSDYFGVIGDPHGASGTNTALITGITADGIASTWTNDGLYIGAGSVGALEIEDGGQVIDSYAYLGDANNGTATVSGVNANSIASTWKSGTLYLGFDGAGTLNVEDGGQVTSTSAYVGYASANGASAVVVTGTNSNGATSTWSIAGSLVVGYSTPGSLSVNAGGQVTDSVGILGDTSYASGSATVDGTGSAWVNTSELVVGSANAGALTISNDALVSSPFVYMADSGPAEATINLESGGVLATDGIYRGTGEAALNFDGGILRATAGSSDFTSNFTSGEVTLQSNGGVFDTNGFNVTVNSVIGGGGALTKQGTGTLTLTAGNTYTGNTTVDAGTLSVSGTGAAIDSAGAVLIVGQNKGDSAALLVSGGAQVAVTDYGVIGYYDGSAGAVTVTGTSSSWNSGSDLEVGYAGGTGSLAISNGGQVTDGYGTLGTLIGSSGSATVTGPGSTWINSGLYVGYDGSGALTVSDGGEVSSASVQLAYDSTGGGTVNLDSGGVLETGQIVNGGGVGGAALNIDGGTLRATANTSFLNGFSAGQITLQSGGGTIDNNGYNVTISSPIGGTGGLTAIGAGTTTLTAANTYTGNTAIDAGTLSVSGTGAAIDNPNAYVFTGYSPGDQATLLISNGGQVTDNSTTLGNAANSSGTVTVSGVNANGTASTWNNSLNLDVGELGSGTLNIEDGGQVSTDGGYLADGVGSTGVATVTGVNADGKASTWENTSLVVGGNGSGTLNVENGGQATDLYGYIGIEGGAIGTATVTGINGSTASLWNNSHALYVGFEGPGTGTLNVEDGGVVEVQFGSGTLTLAYASGSSGTLNIGNGYSAGTIDASEVTGGSGTGQVNFGETDAAYTFAPKLTGSLSVTQNGSGTTVLTGANTYTGGTNVRTGSLVAASSGALGSGPVTVSGGMLSSTSGIGAIVGGDLSLSSGSIALTSSPIPTFQLALNQNFDVTGGTLSLTFSLGTVGSISSLGGDFTLNGGTLNLNDSFTSPADYALTYVVLSGFGSGSVSGLSIIGYDTVDYAAHFSDGGDLTFTPEDAPEPPSWALLLLGGSSCFAAASRRRRNIRIPAL